MLPENSAYGTPGMRLKDVLQQSPFPSMLQHHSFPAEAQLVMLQIVLGLPVRFCQYDI